MKFKSLIPAFSALLLAAFDCSAGVTLIRNSAPGATSWPGSPLFATVSNPAGEAGITESFNGGGGNTNISQTFTVPGTNATLKTILLYAGNGGGGNLLIRLYDLGIQAAPNPSPYTVGTDLLNSGSGLTLSYTPQLPGILEFDFTAADQVTLQSGHMYAFELHGTLNTTNILWQRSSSNAYPGGAAYRNQSWINNNSGRDFAMAVYSTDSPTTNAPGAGQCTIDWNDLRQRIDGFGGGVVFLNDVADPVSSAFMDTAFGTDNTSQLGLTLLRVRIDPAMNWSAALLDAQKAVAHGARVLATPWTAPAAMKDNNALINGGSVLPSQYTNYANYLNGFAAYMKTNGAPLVAISIQNEPDFTATYESCRWTADQFQTFFDGPAALITNAPVMMPESASYVQGLSDATLNDPVAAANVDYVGGHLYGATIADYPLAHSLGKPTWMTEFLLNDQTMGSAITTAKEIHDCLTLGNMSAYIWWKCFGSANGLVNASGVPQKRGFVMAQFSRFLPTNYYRVGVSYDAGACVTAYKDLSSPAFAVVAINTNFFEPVTETLALTNFSAASVTPWVTSGSQSLAVQPAIVVSNGAFVYTLPPLSVVTFVGQAGVNPSNIAPTFLPISDQTINAGIALMITNMAFDPDVPTQHLAFALLSGPTNATLTPLGASNAVFGWRPLVSQAGSTNRITVSVTDDGSPNLSATNSFLLTVNPLTAAQFTSINIFAGQVNLAISGPVGPDYIVWTSTNLIDWQLLLVTNVFQPSFTLPDAYGGESARFYRLQIGP